MPSIDWDAIFPHAIRVGFIIVVSYILWRVVRRAIPTVLRILLRRELRGDDQEEITQRVDTLQQALGRTLLTLITIISAALVLSETGVQIAPLIAGMGVAGLAVGFAAQYIIRDVLNGFVLLVEDWYAKGDVVRIAGVAGLVEDITMRRTVLRDLDGVVHSIPNGEISIASNFTKSWSQINFNVSVSYNESLDHVIAVLNQVGRELADDPAWSTKVLEAPHVLRVDAFADSGIEIKIVGNTRPIRQWDVMGEMRRRIKARFDEEGIEIPYPHTKVYFGNPLEQQATAQKKEAAQVKHPAWQTAEAPSAWRDRERVRDIMAQRPWGLVTDLDGTISPIVPNPDEATVSPAIRAALTRLTSRAEVVAVLSGRKVQQAREITGVQGITYIGQHGLERLEGDALRLAQDAEPFLPVIAAAMDEIEHALKHPGVRVERKGITATIHYRNAAEPEAARFAILQAVSQSRTADGLKIAEGRKVVEVRPALLHNKGIALRELVEAHNLRGVIYLGDDVTDIDAFYAIHGLQKAHITAVAIGVVSSENKPEFRYAADAILTSVDEVEQLLSWMAEIA